MVWYALLVNSKIIQNTGKWETFYGCCIWICVPHNQNNCTGLLVQPLNPVKQVFLVLLLGRITKFVLYFASIRLLFITYVIVKPPSQVLIYDKHLTWHLWHLLIVIKSLSINRRSKRVPGLEKLTKRYAIGRYKSNEFSWPSISFS